MAFEVPPLPYAFDALEPHIDAKTMEIHHDKHHAAYVTNANAALEKHPELARKTVEDLLWGINQVPEDIRTVIRNNAGGHATTPSSGRSWGRAAGAIPAGGSPTRSRARSAGMTSSRNSCRRPRSGSSAAAGPGSSPTARASCRSRATPTRTARSWTS